MKINSKMDNIFSSQLRIVIIGVLISGRKTFNQLKELTDATDGNLSIQLKNLKNKNYIIEDDIYFGKKRNTVYSITELGKNSFVEYVDFLQSILQEKEYLSTSQKQSLDD